MPDRTVPWCFPLSHAQVLLTEERRVDTESGARYRNQQLPCLRLIWKAGRQSLPAPSAVTGWTLLLTRLSPRKLSESSLCTEKPLRLKRYSFRSSFRPSSQTRTSDTQAAASLPGSPNPGHAFDHVFVQMAPKSRLMSSKADRSLGPLQN